MLTAILILATVWAVIAAMWWREQIGGVRRELAEAQHDNAILRAELEACRDTRRGLAAKLEEERRLQRLDATRGAP